MKKIFLLLLSTSLLFGGCYKTDFKTCSGHETPETPEEPEDPEQTTQGTIDLTIVEPTVGTPSGDDYIVYIDGVEHVISDGGLTLTEDIEEGDYTIHIYNMPGDYIFNTDGDNIIVTLPVDGDYIDGNGDELYYGTQDITITAEEISEISAEIDNITRELLFGLNIEGSRLSQIESMTISLSGIASGWDYTNNTYYGDAASISIPSDGFATGRVESTHNLLGIVTTADQTLTVNVKYSDGYPTTDEFIVDLSSKMADFNSDKSTTYSVEETIVLPDEITVGTLDYTIDSSSIADGALDEHIFNANGTESEVGSGDPTTDIILEDGDYEIQIYNKPDDYIFTSPSDNDNIIATLPSTDGVISYNPSDIYYGREDVTITAGEKSSITITPEQITRELNLNIDLVGDSKDLIESMTITLSGIASGWDCTTSSPYGDAASVVITVTDFSSDSITNTLNLLGIVPSEDQTLTIDITYSDNNPSPSSFTVDMNDLLSDFNSDKSTPLYISTTITLPSESDIYGSIGDWEKTEESVTIK